jgi:GxxExxY protein
MDTDKYNLLRVLFDDANPDSEITQMNSITEKIIGCAFKVGNTLGCGFLEKVYENALALELGNIGLTVAQQEDIKVFYEGIEVGKYAADLLIDGRILIELKAVRDLNEIHRAQCMNYLRATGLRLCLLINFGNPRVEVKRVIL